MTLSRCVNNQYEGNMLRVANFNTSLGRKKLYFYDKLSRVTEVKDPAGYAITYSYDVVGNRTAMTTPWGKYNYTYDALNRLTSIVNPQGITVTLAYDAVGRRTKKTIFKTVSGTLAETDYIYDKAGQLLNITNKAGGQVISFARYEYDAAGNRVSREDRDGRTTYSYDLANRLIRADGPMAAETFAYDDNGNRLADKEAKDYVYDAANRIQANNLYTFDHDLSGNLTGRTNKNDSTTITYAYNPEQQLSEVITPEHTVQYKYDPLGRRIEKTVDGNIQRYVYDNEDIIVVLDADGNPLQTFTHGPGIDEPLIMTKADGANYFYHADALGSIVALTDDKGETAQTMKYQAYGKPVIILYDQVAAGNPYYFTARELDAETGLYYYRARYYDFRRDAFTQEDPIGFSGGDVNSYRYVTAQPINHNDPSGQITPVLAPIIIGGGLGLGTSFLGTLGSQLLTENIDWGVVGKSTLAGGLTGAAMPFLGTAKLGAVLLGAGGSAAQYYFSTGDANLNTKDALLSVLLGAAGGHVGGTFVMPKPTIFAPTPWWRIATDNATSVGLGRGATGAFIGGLKEKCAE
ncbi:MAG: YD repeat-containing protein [Elusimicrobia bacterium]|nr:MAG: YD repeat-containing protein [Elusimicrobiota bacterium]KAF0155159.1 MAG: YD repeat-containing protein [Elusimicrobiota bacterium]